MEKYDAHRSIVHGDCQFFHNFTKSMIKYCMYSKFTFHDKWWFNEFHFNYFMHDYYYWIQILCTPFVFIYLIKANATFMKHWNNSSTIYMISSLATRTNLAWNIFPIGILNGIYEDFNVTPITILLTVWQKTLFIFNFLSFYFLIFIFTKYIHQLCKSDMKKQQKFHCLYIVGKYFKYEIHFSIANSKLSV